MSEAKEEKKVEIKTEQPVETKEETKKGAPVEEKKSEQITTRKYAPLSTFRTIDRFFNDLTRWFDDILWTPSRFWDFEPLSLSIFNEDPFFRTPLANITDEGDYYNLTAELPGLEKGDLEITIHDGSLEIKGEKKEEHEEKKEGYFRREYGSSSYYRSFGLPDDVLEDNIEATLDKGILKLTLPKKEEEKKEKKKIEVN